jgi:hypothetical protein
MCREVVSEDPGRDGNAVRTDCIIVIASVASMGDADRWRRLSCVGLNKAEIPLPERPSVDIVEEMGLWEGVESPKALFLAALKASPPSAFTPLRTVPPTLRAACPTSPGVTGCRRTLMLCAERGSNPDEESTGEWGDANARRRPDRAKTGRGLAMGTTSPGLSKECVATRVLLNLLSLLLLMYDVVECERDTREVDGTVNNSTKFEDEIMCNAGADVLWEGVNTDDLG